VWPARQVKEGYDAVAVATKTGKLWQGYPQEETVEAVALRDATTGERVVIPRSDLAETRRLGTLMPDGLLAAMSDGQKRDLLRFLLDLGRSQDLSTRHTAAPGTFPYDRAHLNPEDWPSWQRPVNRDRVYDFYAKEADYFRTHPGEAVLPPFPGLDGGKYGHWGNQNDDVWADDRWNRTDLGTVLCGVFRGAGVTVPKGVCVRLGDRGEMAACFNPETLCYEAVWEGGFVSFSRTRHGFLDGLRLRGTALPRPSGRKPEAPFVYRGFYRYGRRVIFAYRVGGVEMLDAPWI
jgi:hypothetical protein